MLVGLACGCEATLRKNLADGLDCIAYHHGAACQRHLSTPALPVALIGFGPLWTWDANRADFRELPASTVARFEPEHLYKLLEGYFYVNEPGKGYPGYGPIARAHWKQAVPSH